MERFGVIFCGQCNSMMVDSGFDEAVSTLRCCKCGNIGEFKVGKVRLDENDSNRQMLELAKKDARI